MLAAENHQEVLQVKKLSPHAILPSRGSEWAAGYDLSSAEDTVVPARGKAIVKTDLSIAIPLNTYARIAPRSGLAVKKFIDVGAGVVDYDYRGPVGIVLFNHADEDFQVKRGDRVAQLILERICMADVVEVEELPSTTRGAGGFGSTGVSTGGQEGATGKRARPVVPSNEEGAGTVASLLVFLRDLAATADDPTTKDLILSLKPRALSGDVRLLAAKQAYDQRQDKEDLLSTLRILASRSNGNSMDTN